MRFAHGCSLQQASCKSVGFIKIEGDAAAVEDDAEDASEADADKAEKTEGSVMLEILDTAGQEEFSAMHDHVRAASASSSTDRNPLCST